MRGRDLILKSGGAANGGGTIPENAIYDTSASVITDSAGSIITTG